MIYIFYTYGLEKLILELLSYLMVFWLNYHSLTDSGKKRKETRKKERKKEERIKEGEERKTSLKVLEDFETICMNDVTDTP